MAAPLYADKEHRDHFGNYRIPAGFVYTEATITPEKARELARKHAVLTLVNVTEVSVDVAEALVTPYEDTFLTLPAVTRLDEEAAKSLGKRPCFLRLWGLETLTPEVAAALVAHHGHRLELNGVKEVSLDTARALASGKRTGGISLGLRSLPSDIAGLLAGASYDLHFVCLETLGLESAKELCKHRNSLGFGPAEIAPDVAEVLLSHDGPLSFMRVKKLKPGVGDILARHKFEVQLMLEEIDSVALAKKIFSESNKSSSVFRLRTMSPEIAAEYAQADPGYLASLDSLSIEAATELANCASSLELPALTHLSPELARAITAREGKVYLRGIKNLDGPDAVAVAEALASTPAPVYVGHLERVSAPALAALRKKPSITIPSDDKLTIVP
jgi:hypothetical protein